MSNRDVVLKMLFEEYMDKYQLLIFTHDRQFFNIAKHKIEFNYDKSKWGFWEFYVDERTAIEKPRIFENETELSVANKHLLNNDYPAAANYLRKYCEKIIEKNLPEFLYANIEKKESNTTNTLDSVLISSSIFLTRLRQPAAFAKINEVKQYVKMLLNPLSHTERGVERYKGEIKNVMKLLDELEPLLSSIHKKKIINSNENIFLKLQKTATQFYRIKLKLREDLYIADTATGIQISFVQTDSEHFWELDDTGAVTKEGQYTFIQNKELFDSYTAITTHKTVSIPVVPNWQSLISIEDGTTLDALMVF